eukprot:2838132-Rhodomonas_salina.1
MSDRVRCVLLPRPGHGLLCPPQADSDPDHHAVIAVGLSSSYHLILTKLDGSMLMRMLVLMMLFTCQNDDDDADADADADAGADDAANLPEC